jgi:outer membrane murein-binding lipoprotein Lpp/outer membrane lipoprotein SlyB
MTKKIILVTVVIMATVWMVGCSSTARMVEHARMQSNVSMSDSLFLNLAKERTAYIKVTNTSDMQELQCEPMIKGRLAAKGITIVNNPAEASWIIQANVLRVGYMRVDSMGRDLSALGTVAGGIAGALIPKSGKDSLVGALVGSAVGNVAGAVAGSLVKIGRYTGTVELQVQERADAPVRGTEISQVRQGSSTTVNTERAVQTSYQTYRTTLSVEAIQTNISKEEAAQVLAEKVAEQVAGLF